MPTTKIINVQKGDSFDEVFDTFSKTEAQDIVFIFPKGTVFGRDENYLQTISAAGAKAGKTLSVMTTDPVVTKLAAGNGMAILQNTSAKKTLPKQVIQSEPEPELTPEPMAELAVARKIKDIVTAEKDTALKIKTSAEKEEKLEIKHDMVQEKIAVDPTPRVSEIEKLWEEEEKKQNIVPEKPKHKISKKFIYIPAIIAFVALGVIMYLTLGSAKIIVKPKTQEVNFTMEATAATDVQEVSLDFKSIPGQQFTIKKEATGSYPTSSQKQVAQKASGKIKIYNTSKESQRLVATTRFATKEGLIFRIPETITVVASGSVESLVYADQAGKEYNIGPTRFNIPGFEGTPKYNQFYAISETAMSGGIVGMVKVVSENDFLKAKEELTEKARKETADGLKSQVGDLKYLEPVDINIEQPTVNAKVGEAADNLEMTVKASAVVVAFRPSDLDTLIAQYLDKNGSLQLIEKNKKIELKQLSTVSAGQNLKFEVKVSGIAAAKFDQEKLLREIGGIKTSQEALKNFFGGFPEISSATVKPSPFWLTKVPKDVDKLELIIDTE